MQFRQIIVVLVAFIVIVGAALFVVSWDGDGETDSASDDTGSTTTATAPTTTTTTSTPTTTTDSLPPPCESGRAGTADDTTADDTTADDTTADDTTADDTTAGETTTDDTTAVDTTAVDTTEPDAPLEPTLGTNSSVSTVGLDTVAFGLTVFQAEQAAGTEMRACDPVGECYRVAPVEAPEGIVFVVTDGTIERVDIVGGPITTRSGIGIGTEEGRIVELFGDSLERRVVDDSSVELVFVPTSERDAEFRVVFTIRDGEVERFRAGRVPFVLDPQPCV